jgi:hypothetical protein
MVACAGASRVPSVAGGCGFCINRSFTAFVFSELNSGLNTSPSLVVASFVNRSTIAAIDATAYGLKFEVLLLDPALSL